MKYALSLILLTCLEIAIIIWGISISPMKTLYISLAVIVFLILWINWDSVKTFVILLLLATFDRKSRQILLEKEEEHY